MAPVCYCSRGLVPSDAWDALYHCPLSDWGQVKYEGLCQAAPDPKRGRGGRGRPSVEANNVAAATTIAAIFAPGVFPHLALSHSTFLIKLPGM